LSSTRDSQNSNPSVSERFRHEVTSTLALADPTLRQALRGTYLFSVDGRPSFLVEISSIQAVSSEIALHFTESIAHPSENIAKSDLGLNAQDFRVLDNLEANARVHVITDSSTLERLLNGTMKAKKAFLVGKVSIKGDLPIFLKLVGFLKEMGIRPPGADPKTALFPSH
jgi:hypothetical protein